MFTLDPSNSSFIDTLDFFIKVLGGIGGFTLFIIGFIRYSKSQYWKKNEFVANEMKIFNQDKMVINCKRMLDWDKRKIELFPEKKDYESRFITVNRELIRSSLISHNLKNIFKKEEVAIRDNFDHFFDQLEKFQHFIEANLFTEKELEPYLLYWVEIMSDGLDFDTRNVIYHYLKEYKYKGVQDLFKKFHKNILPSTEIESTYTGPEPLQTSGLPTS